MNLILKDVKNAKILLQIVMNAQAHPFVMNVMLITIFKTHLKFVKQHAQLRQKKMKQYHGLAYPVI